MASFVAGSFTPVKREAVKIDPSQEGLTRTAFRIKDFFDKRFEGDDPEKSFLSDAAEKPADTATEGTGVATATEGTSAGNVNQFGAARYALPSRRTESNESMVGPGKVVNVGTVQNVISDDVYNERLKYAKEYSDLLAEKMKNGTLTQADVDKYTKMVDELSMGNNISHQVVGSIKGFSGGGGFPDTSKENKLQEFLSKMTPEQVEQFKQLTGG